MNRIDSIDHIQSIVRVAIDTYKNLLGLDKVDPSAVLQLGIILHTGALEALAQHVTEGDAKASRGRIPDGIDVSAEMKEEMKKCGFSQEAAERVTELVLGGVGAYYGNHKPDMAQITKDLLKGGLSTKDRAAMRPGAGRWGVSK